MFHWNPSHDVIEKWTPESGWNSIFSEKDKLQCTSLFFFFKNKKGCNEKSASIMAQMVVFKQKNNGLLYSEEQEATLRRALQPILDESLAR